MPQFDRLGNDMSDDIAECEADEQDKLDAAHEAHMTSLVEAVKNHAKAHYNEGGWDMVVECYEDSEIREAIAGCRTAEEAIARLAEVADIYHDRRLDAYHAGGLDDNGRLPEEKTHTEPSHCTCQCPDDTCPFHAYKEWMEDLAHISPVCQDGGYKPYNPDTLCGRHDRFYHTSCFLSQEALDSDIPF